MKTLYKFTAKKTEKVKEEVKDKNEKGEEVIVVKEVDKITEVPFCILKPTRHVQAEASAFYNVTYADCIRKKMITRAQIVKTQSNDGWIFSEDELKNYKDYQIKLLKNQEEYKELSLKKDEDRTPEEKKKHEDLANDMYSILKELKKYEMAEEGLFSHTAEHFSYNEFIVWWILKLSAKIGEKEAVTALFPGKEHDDRLKVYDDILDSEDEFTKSVIRDFTFLITYWASGGAETEEDFNRILLEARKNRGEI